MGEDGIVSARGGDKKEWERQGGGGCPQRKRGTRRRRRDLTNMKERQNKRQICFLHIKPQLDH